MWLERQSPRTMRYAVIMAVCAAMAVPLVILIFWLSTSPATSVDLGVMTSQQDMSEIKGRPAEKMVMQSVDSQSSSVIESLCGHHSCSAHYDDGVTDVLVTSDRRVVLTFMSQQSIVVQSSSSVQTVTLGCFPGGVTELSRKRIAVTCPTTNEVLVVSLESSDHDQIQHIPTGKQYTSVAAHTVETLIVGAGASVDVITLQGKVVRTLVDTHQWNVTDVHSLTVTGGSLLVTGAGIKQIHRIPLSVSSQPPVETLAGNFPSWPMDTAVDKAGNVFIVLQDGGVLVRNTEGHDLQLLAGRKKYWRCYVALFENRLLLATRIINTASYQWKSVVTEYQLVNRDPFTAVL